MQISQTTDRDFIRRILFDRSVWRFVQGETPPTDEQLDDAILNPLNVWIRVGDVGFVAFLKADNHTYGIHIAFLRTGRGMGSFSGVKDAIVAFFNLRPEAKNLIATCRASVARWGRHLGFRLKPAGNEFFCTLERKDFLCQ